jgi:hypothetical protein
MGYLSYWVTWIPEGQTEEEALNSHSGGYIELDEDGVPSIGPADPGPGPPAPSADGDLFLRRAIDELRAMEPSLVEDTDERRLVDDHLRVTELSDNLGHWIHLSPGQAWLRPDRSDSATFDRFWGYLKILTALAPSVCESEYSTVEGTDRIDVSIDLDEARDLYGWD